MPEDFNLERDKRWHLKTHFDRVCRTSGCFTYVLDKRDRYCLACQLDRDIPQPALRRGDDDDKFRRPGHS